MVRRTTRRDPSEKEVPLREEGGGPPKVRVVERVQRRPRLGGRCVDDRCRGSENGECALVNTSVDYTGVGSLRDPSREVGARES